MKHRIGLISVFGVWLVTMLAVPAQAELNIDGYSLVSKTRVSRVAFNYTYRAEITNTGPEVENVAAELSSKNPNTLIVDDSLNFGSIAAGDTVTSTDTFTIRQDRRHPFNWANMSWDVSFDVPTPAGVLLEGPPGMLAVDAMVDLPPVPVEPNDIAENGLFLNQLNVIIRPDASVEQINSALLQIGGRITSMTPGLPFLTVAIPRHADIDAITGVIDILKQSPGIISAFPSYEPELDLVPGDLDLASIDHLARARFPAAWNAAALAFDAEDESNCARRIHVLVADNFGTPSASLLAELGSQLPDFVVSGSTEGDKTHGWNVTATLGAKLDGAPPTGANPAPPAPLPTCLNLRGLNITGFGAFDIARALADEIFGIIKASGAEDVDRVIVNTSFGYINRCPVVRFISTSCDADARTTSGSSFEPTDAIDRAFIALYWKTYLRHIELDAEQFLVVASAGNTKNNQSASIHPGLGVADYNSFLTVAARADSDFSFISNAILWPAEGDPRLSTGDPIGEFTWPSLLASPDEAADFRFFLEWVGMAGVPPLNNVIVVGSTTNPVIDLSSDDRLNRLDTNVITESDFSSNDGFFNGGVIEETHPIILPPRLGNLGLGADVYAPGERVSLLQELSGAGTSFAAPQVTGLASYLWLIAPVDEVPTDLVALTIKLITDNVEPGLCQAHDDSGYCVRRINHGLIDAYTTSLTLDLDPDLMGVPAIQFGEAPVREAILDIDDDGLFEEQDLKRYLLSYYQGNFLDPEVAPVQPLIRNYSRLDLNGDGFTGGESVDRFDLDLLASPEVTPVYDQILLPITLPSASMPIERSFDENSLTDLDILCYYAFSPLYYGDLIGVRGLGSLTWLSDCVDIETVFDLPSDILLSSTVQFAAHVLDAENRTLVDSTETFGWEQFRWTSSNPDVAVVDALGRLHVAGTGSTTIGVSYGRAATSVVLSVPFEEPLLEPTDVYSNMDYNSVLGACQLQSGSGEGGSHSIYLNQFVFENAVVLETVADVANVRDPALVWVRATGGIMPTDVVYPASGDVILQYGVPGFVLSEILAAGTDAEGCPSISYRSYGYQPHVADTPWPLWQLPVTSALPYTGAIEQPLWIEIEPPVPALLGAGEAALRSTAGNAALQITIAENGTHSVNISAVAPWVVSWVSAVNPIDERERIIAIVERDGVAYEIDLALAMQEDEGGRFLEVEELTGWHCGLGIGGQCPGWFDTNIAGSP